MGNRGILTICFAAFLVVIFACQANSQLYATSEVLDRFNGSSWSHINLTGDGVRTLQVGQVGSDSVGNIYVSYALVGTPRPYPLLMKFTPSDKNTTFSLFNGRFAIDANNFMYNIYRYTPIGTCLNPITKIDTTSDLTDGDVVGYVADVNDIVFDGDSIVIVGGFYRAYSADLSQFVRATHVARFDGSSWSAIGEGIDDVPSRIVVDHNKNLVALVTPGDIWRWDGSVWTSYSLNLTAPSGTPEITDLDFGSDKLFVVGNFDSINGVAAANVATLKWNGTDLTVKEAFSGIPDIVAKSVLATSDNKLIWVGGSLNDTKTVFALRNETWVNTGFISDPNDSSDTTITGLVFISA